MRTLSSFEDLKKIAYCRNCNKLFIDDMTIWGVLYCPECKWDLNRGVKILTIKTKEGKEYNVDGNT